MIVLFVLMLCNYPSNSMNLTDLSRVCVYYFPFDTSNTVIAPPQGICTAVSSYCEYGTHHPLFYTGIPLSYLALRKPVGTEDVPRATHGSEGHGSEGHGSGGHGSGGHGGGKLGDDIENLDKIDATGDESTVNEFKHGLPYVYIFDADGIDNFVQNVLPDIVNSFADDLDKLITANSVDAIVFDFIDASDDELYIFLPDFQTNLKSFFDLMKKRHSNLLLGVKLHKKADVNKSALDEKVIDASIDFYVVSTYEYAHCTYHKHQIDMALPPSPEQMMCVAHPGKKRKYCRGTLDNFYQEGKVIFDNKLPGVFIQAIDCDDFLGSCGCDPFPVARAINDGLTGTPENKTLSNCRTFGLLPKEREHLK